MMIQFSGSGRRVSIATVNEWTWARATGVKPATSLRTSDPGAIAQCAMKYKEYKALRAQGRIRAGIDSSVALSVGKYLPARYSYAVAFWNIVALLTVPGAIIAGIFLRWWVGLIILFFVTPTIFAANRKSAIGFVLQYAEENEDFFNALVENDLLVFRE